MLRASEVAKSLKMGARAGETDLETDDQAKDALVNDPLVIIPMANLDACRAQRFRFDRPEARDLVRKSASGADVPSRGGFTPPKHTVLQNALHPIRGFLLSPPSEFRSGHDPRMATASP